LEDELGVQHVSNNRGQFRHFYCVKMGNLTFVGS
jgi:hypothetical protein